MSTIGKAVPQSRLDRRTVKVKKRGYKKCRTVNPKPLT